MSELVDMSLGQRIKPSSLDLSAKPFNPLDVDERPPPIVKLVNAQHHAQLLATVLVDNPFRVYSCIPNETASHIGEAQ